MKRKDYQKPTMRVVKLQHRTCMLAGSPLTSTSTNLDEEDDIDISDTPGSIWGRYTQQPQARRGSTPPRVTTKKI